MPDEPKGQEPKATDAGTPLEKPVTTQEQFDRMVQERIARERAKFADYEELQKFKSEHQKAVDEQATKDLEARKQYDTLKQGFEKKIGDLTTIVSQKDSQIQSMAIDHSLTTEVSKQGGHVEESLALLRGGAVVVDGNVRIKGKDANGQETTYSVEEGVKEFLKARPHLVKATNRPGAGSGGGEGGSQPAAGTEDLASLTKEFQLAQQSGDAKKIAEIRGKMQRMLYPSSATRR